MTISDLKVGQEFFVKGLLPTQKDTITECVLIEYKGMNNYVVDAEGCLLLFNGDNKVFLK